MYFQERNLMHKSNSIVALSTPHGTGAISVIRISGEDSIRIVEKLFIDKKKKILSKQKSHTVHFGEIINNKDVIDEVLVTIFKAPHSYTAENTVEISCHGSNFIQQEIINLIIENGARLAKPGEFTLRAFLNGKLDLNQAEAVADLISSENESSHRLAMQHMRKDFSNDLNNLRDELIKFTSLIELELDFSEEDVEFADRKQFKSLLKKIQTELKILIDSFKSGNVLKNGVSVAIAGKPNAGKSSLLNTLLKEEKAIVSDIPGTTRDSIEDSINIKGIKFRFIDTAGLRETEDIIESKGITKTKEKIRSSQFLIFLFDVNDTTIEEIDKTLKDFDRQDLKIILVRNKIDLKIQNFDLINNLKNRDIIEISAIDNKSVNNLKEILFSQVKISNTKNNTIVSNSRHLEALNNALEGIEEVQEGLKKNLSGDLLSIDIKKSIEYIGEITGEITNDEVLGNIFSKFCIGK